MHVFPRFIFVGINSRGVPTVPTLSLPEGYAVSRPQQHFCKDNRLKFEQPESSVLGGINSCSQGTVPLQQHLRHAQLFARNSAAAVSESGGIR